MERWHWREFEKIIFAKDDTLMTVTVEGADGEKKKDNAMDAEYEKKTDHTD